MYTQDIKTDFFSFAICFNMKIFETFMEIINKNRNNLFLNEKNKKFKEIVKYLNDNLERNKNLDDKNVVNFFLYFDILFKDDIMQKNSEKRIIRIKADIKPNFNINNNLNLSKKSNKIKEKEKIDKIETPELITSKKILREILINIEESDINELKPKIKMNSFKEVLKTIKNYYIEKNLSQINININIHNLFNSNKTPIEWQINILLNNLDKIGDFYTRNDYSNLFISLSNDINNGIKNYDFNTNYSKKNTLN